MTKTRMKVLKYWMFSNKNSVTFKELFSYFFAKSYSQKAMSCIDKIEKGSEMNKIYFKGQLKPLFYPKVMSIQSLKQVIVESFFIDNWHYYEIPQTSVYYDDVVVDCGAAEGLFSFLLSHRCKRLFIIEPLPDFIQCLNETFKTDKNIEILPLAISDLETTASILADGISSTLITNVNGIDVTVTTLDKLFFEKGIPISYIKIDLEGYDYKALLGAENLIRKNKPKIAVTTYHKFEHSEEIATYLKWLVPEYNILTKGIYQETGSPMMLHAWI